MKLKGEDIKSLPIRLNQSRPSKLEDLCIWKNLNKKSPDEKCIPCTGYNIDCSLYLTSKEVQARTDEELIKNGKTDTFKKYAFLAAVTSLLFLSGCEYMEAGAKKHDRLNYGYEISKSQ